MSSPTEVPLDPIKRRQFSFLLGTTCPFHPILECLRPYIHHFKAFTRFFRRSTTAVAHQASGSIDGDTWNDQEICVLTGQLGNIPLSPTAYGGCSDVWKCDWIKDGAVVKVAAKTIRQQSSIDADALEKALKRGKRELHVWMRLQHDHILPLYGIAHDFSPGITAMVCPWLENGTVTRFIESHPTLTRGHRLQLISDAAAGLHYRRYFYESWKHHVQSNYQVHSQSIVHGDLSGSNILVCVRGRAYLTDFGLSAILAEYNMASHSLTCAARWAAPEIARVDILDSLSVQNDMYSFGSIMFHILSGIIPYSNLSNILQVVAAILKGEKPPRPEDPQISDQLWNFIEQCWLPYEQRCHRPSADDAYNLLQYELRSNI